MVVDHRIKPVTDKGTIRLQGGKPTMSVRWAVTSIALPGEVMSGDLHVVHAFDGGVMLGAVDGLGHGDEAAFAAQSAVRSITRQPDDTIISIVENTHRALQATRGVVMSLASFRSEDRSLTWLSVGNVEGTILRANSSTVPSREMIISRGGVIGYHLPPLLASIHQVSPGDVLIFATDGVRNFADAVAASTPAPLDELTRRLCIQYSKGTDDALVLAARFDENVDE